MEENTARHEIILENRRKLSVTGVKEVIGFDECSVEIATEEGILTVEGTDLKVGTLDTALGALKLEGNVDSVSYRNDKTAEKKSFFDKLFH